MTGDQDRVGLLNSRLKPLAEDKRQQSRLRNRHGTEAIIKKKENEKENCTLCKPLVKGP